ncbi:MAG: NRDE family protein [Thermoguttaceae bacterium]
MGIIAVHYQMAKDSPLLVALNREEHKQRPSQPPRIQSGRPRVVCGIDRQAGGTWAGVNQHGLFVAIVNCPKRVRPSEPRSRGVLCKELLGSKDAEEALEKGLQELSGGAYLGGNFLCVDRHSGGVVYGGDEVEVERLRPGLHLLSESRLNDYHDGRQEFVRRLLTLQRLDSAVSFLAVSSRTFSRKPDVTGKRGIVIAEHEYGTVSSMLLSLTERTQKSIMQFAAGPPNEKPFEDVSALLRQVLSTDRANRAVAAAREAAAREAAAREAAAQEAMLE